MNDKREKKGFCKGNPTIICAALIQHLLSNEAKWNMQINEDVVIKIKSCGSYTFLNNEHCGYWRGNMGFSPPLIWHTSQISFNQNLSSAKCSLGLYVF